MDMHYRQGDVLIVAVKEIPAKAVSGKRDKGRIVLAYGEVTGHAHAITERTVMVYEHEGTRYIRVPKKGAELRHEEHGAIALAGGSYEIRIQREYTPQAIVNVRD
jgi:hypothetical protein